MLNLLEGERGLISYYENQKIKRTTSRRKERRFLSQLALVEKKNRLLTDKVDLDYLEMLYREKFMVGKSSERISTKVTEMTVRHPEKVNNPINPIKKKPSWIRTRILDSQNYFKTKEIINKKKLHTVCQEASCPNISECWSKRSRNIYGDGRYMYKSMRIL